jgi:hypothetical protein
MTKTPHREKLLAAIANPKCKKDISILREAEKAYNAWINKISSLTSTGKQKVLEMTDTLNEYKDYLEVELIARQGSPFIKRQKGQLKLDNSVIEEFLIHLIDPSILSGLPSFELEIGSQTAFMSLSFRPSGISKLDDKPDVVLKLKDQDFTIGKTIYYKFSADSRFDKSKTEEGSLFLAVLAVECKVNYDKTMFQECAGTASRLKQGCPISKYYTLVEYLDMNPEDCRLTDIDNVFLLRHAKRLPFEKRSIYKEVREQHKNFPIDGEVVYQFVQEIQNFIDAAWYDPDEALKRGSFV